VTTKTTKKTKKKQAPNEHVKVLFHAKGEDPETVWCLPAGETKNGGSLFIVDNIPFLHASPTFGDLIEAAPDKEGVLTLRRLHAAGGRYPMIVDYPRSVPLKALDALVRAEEIASEGCFAPEGTAPGRLYLAVPETRKPADVFALLTRKFPKIMLIHPELKVKAAPKKAAPKKAKAKKAAPKAKKAAPKAKKAAPKKRR
jgi:hypothetical protein